LNKSLACDRPFRSPVNGGRGVKIRLRGGVGGFLGPEGRKRVAHGVSRGETGHVHRVSAPEGAAEAV